MGMGGMGYGGMMGMGGMYGGGMYDSPFKKEINHF